LGDIGKGKFIDIGIPETYRIADKLFMQGVNSGTRESSRTGGRVIMALYLSNIIK
jgi:hypothetical protein